MGGIPTDIELVITFREPFPQVRYEPNKVMYIKAITFGGLEHLIKISSTQQINIIEELLRQDGKILNARVFSKDERFEVIEHSPQSDFLDLIEGGK